MRRLPSKPRPRSALRAHLTADVAGIGLAMSVLAGPPASAEPDGPTSAQLAEVNGAVDETAGPGVAWYTDPAAGKVVVTVDSTVSAAERDTIREAAGGVPDSLTIQRADGVFTPLLGPGDAIHGPDVWCSAGFNAGADGERYLITAGHCGDQASTWYADSDETVLVGPTVDSTYPGNDYALVRYDSGGALYDGSTALGITSGGSGDCPGQGTTFYQPILEVLHEYGVRLY